MMGPQSTHAATAPESSYGTTNWQSKPGGAVHGPAVHRPSLPMILKVTQGLFTVFGLISFVVGMMKLSEYNDTIRAAREADHKISNIGDAPKLWLWVGFSMIAVSLVTMFIQMMHRGGRSNS